MNFNSSSAQKVLVYLSPAAGSLNLLALHALLSVDATRIHVVYERKLRDLIPKYIQNPFLEAQWIHYPYYNSSEIPIGDVHRGAFAGIVVQTANLKDNKTTKDLALIKKLSHFVPVTILDMADQAGTFAFFSLNNCNYLKGSCFRGCKITQSVKQAPYLTWGLTKERAKLIQEGRPIDICFLGSMSTNPCRPIYVHELENWVHKEFPGVKLSLQISEKGQPHRLSARKYHNILSNSKICVDLWGHASQTKRLYEGLVCGCLVLAQEPRWQLSKWTPQDGVHFLTFHSFQELIYLIKHHLKEEELRRRIALRGFNWVHRIFSVRSIGEWLFRHMGNNLRLQKGKEYTG